MVNITVAATHNWRVSQYQTHFSMSCPRVCPSLMMLPQWSSMAHLLQRWISLTCYPSTLSPVFLFFLVIPCAWCVYTHVPMVVSWHAQRTAIVILSLRPIYSPLPCTAQTVIYSLLSVHILSILFSLIFSRLLCLPAISFSICSVLHSPIRCKTIQYLSTANNTVQGVPIVTCLVKKENERAKCLSLSNQS